MRADAMVVDVMGVETIQADTMVADVMGVETIRADTMPADTRGADMMGTDTMRADAMILPDVVPIDSSLPPDGRTADVGSDTVPNYTVAFSAGKAVGAMLGNGWVAMGAKDTVTSPTCGASAQPITATAACAADSINWNATNALCLSGVVPALSSSPTPLEYTENWGVQIGVNASEPLSPLGRAFRTVAFNLTGTPTTGLRAVLHINGTPTDAFYCALRTSEAPIPLTSFNTSCWDGKGTYLATDDIPRIDHIDIQVSPTSQEIKITNLCLTSIVLGS
jgi:hypothetical protein